MEATARVNAEIQKLAILRYNAEFVPLYRETARALVLFNKLALRLTSLYHSFKAVEATCLPSIDALESGVSQGDIERLVSNLIEKKILDPSDPILRDVDSLTVGDIDVPLAADYFLESLLAYPDAKYDGRGIVIAGGGKYWPSVYVSVRMIRHVGCTLPVQVWYLGEAERDDRYAELLAPFGVELVDALAHPAAAACRCLTGHPDRSGRNGPRHPPFEVKTFAVLHSRFEEVLYLDADCYPCADPTPVFDDERYRATGAVYWPDVAHTHRWTRWADWQVTPRGPECGLETGVYLLNKRLAWRPLNLARFYDDHGDWCYGWGRHHDHGDKGPHRVAWAKLQMDFTMFATKAVWKKVAFLQPGPDGVTPMFVHRCGSKLVINRTQFRSTPQFQGATSYHDKPNHKWINCWIGLPLEEQTQEYLDDLGKLMLGADEYAKVRVVGHMNPIQDLVQQKIAAREIEWAERPSGEMYLKLVEQKAPSRPAWLPDGMPDLRNGAPALSIKPPA